jgi:hypothetical protein
MGTTLVGLVMVNDGEKDYWLAVNLGDSRLYRYAHGEMVQLTVDHSYVQELVDAGRIRADEARSHPQRNIITRVLGTRNPPEAEYWLLAPEAGERYLLCSDGLFAELLDHDIARLLAEIKDPGLAASTLVYDALAAGSRDNATAIVIDVQVGASFAAHDDTAPGVKLPLTSPAEQTEPMGVAEWADRGAPPEWPHRTGGPEWSGEPEWTGQAQPPQWADQTDRANRPEWADLADLADRPDRPAWADEAPPDDRRNRPDWADPIDRNNPADAADSNDWAKSTGWTDPADRNSPIRRGRRARPEPQE